MPGEIRDAGLAYVRGPGHDSADLGLSVGVLPRNEE